jgi:hypothetical protein
MKTNEALERYFRAFEEETLPAAACGSRIGELSEKLRGLEARRDELALDEEDAPEPLSADARDRNGISERP